MQLNNLKNLGATSINWLGAAGISNYEDLLALGPVEAYARVKERNIKVSKVLLYALHGALNDQHWTELNTETKETLLKAADERISSSLETAMSV